MKKIKKISKKVLTLKNRYDILTKLSLRYKTKTAGLQSDGDGRTLTNKQ